MSRAMWLNWLLGSRKRSLSSAGQARQKNTNRIRGFRPNLEALEERTLLSTGTGPQMFPFYQPSPFGGAAPAFGSFTPAQIRTAYGINNILFNGSIVGDGTGQTIAVVNAFDNPAFVSDTDVNYANSDLHQFNLRFGLPDPPSFKKVDQIGGTSYPVTATAAWAGEIALDVEWVHALAPMASIILVEADDDFSLFTAAQNAANMPGVSVVSMSFGAGETASDPSFNNMFLTPASHINVTFVAATGDTGAPGSYPAYAPSVLAVGGTSLFLNGDNSYNHEDGWSGSGGGTSLFQTQPSYQLGVQATGFRTQPDVSFLGDPSTGVAVYDSFNNGTVTPWSSFLIGGTSLAAPCWAALIAIANQGRIVHGLQTLDGLADTLPKIYQLPASAFHDVTVGNNGFAAAVGYDRVTGIGSPIADILVPLLAVNAGATITETGGTTNVAEAGATDTFTVVLNTAPTANVLVTLAPGTQVTLNRTTLTFTSLNWNTAQTVTVTAVNDAVAEGAHTGVISLTASSTDATYSGIAINSVTANITDNDTAGVTITQTGGTTNVTEGGATDTYTIVLTSQPTVNVVININAGAQATVSQSSVTFTPANWNLFVTLTVTAIDDLAIEGAHTGVIMHSAATTDTFYSGIGINDVTANITDNDFAPGVTVVETGGATAVTEGGATDTYTIVLNSIPTANVIISLNSGSQLSLSATSITFTTLNWNTVRTITVTAVDDIIIEGPHIGVISHTATSTDTNYGGIGIANVTANITDNDVLTGVTIVQSGGSTDVTEGGATDTYTVVLNSAPTANVVITVNPNAQLTVIPAPLTFTSGNWSVAQTVTVTAVNDAVAEGNHTGTITHTAASADPTYNNIAIAGVTANITDNDSAGVTIAQSGGSTNLVEGGTTDTYTAVLNTVPAASVFVTISPDSQLTTVPTRLTFTGLNWNVPQTITLTAVDDALVESSPHAGIVTHTVSSADTFYSGLAVADVTANITDNDSPSVVVAESGGSTSMIEGGTDTYTVVLNALPSASVTVSVLPGAEVTVSANSLLFTTGNWNVAQTVTVTAVDDGAIQGMHLGVVTQTVASADAAYNGIAVASVTASIIDNDGDAIQGTSGADQILVTTSSDRTKIMVSVNGTVTPLSVATTSQVLIDGGDGADDIQITDSPVPVVVMGGLGQDRLFLAGKTGSNSFSLDSAAVTVNGVSVNILDIDNLIVAGKAANDTFTVVNVPTYPVEFKGDAGADRVIGNDGANTWAITSTNTGTLNQAIKLTAIESMTGGAGADDFVFSPGKGVTGYIDGGGGSNTLDYSQYTSAITVNMQYSAVSGVRSFKNVATILGGKGADTVIGANQSNQWDLSGSNGGTLIGGLSFQGIENIGGGTKDDTFLLGDASSFAKIDGAAGSDFLDFSACSASVTVNLQSHKAYGVGGFANVEGATGGSATDDALVGTNKAATWNLTAADMGKFSDVSSSFYFAGLEDLIGGPAVDTFRGDGSWSGLVDGGAGANVLLASNLDHTWDITGLNAGTLDGQAFQNVPNLVGNSGADTFLFQAGQKITGKISGGSGGDVLDYSSYGAAAINLQTGTATGAASVTGFEQFVGDSTVTNTLVAFNRSNLWTLTGTNIGSLDGLTFIDFQNLVGGVVDDTFSVAASGGWTGTVNGGTGADLIVAASGSVYVPTGTTTGTLNGQVFVGVERHR